MTRRSHRILVLAPVGLALACSAAPAPPPCAAPPVASETWPAVSTVYIAFRVPPGFHAAPPRIVDSWMRRYLDADGRALLQYDYGGAPADPGIAGGQTCSEVIGGHRVTLATGRIGRTQTGSRYVAIAVWKDVEPGTSLSAWAEAPDPARLATLLAAIRTVRFQRR